MTLQSGGHSAIWRTQVERVALKQEAKDDAKQQKIDAKTRAEEEKNNAKEYKASLKIHAYTTRRERRAIV